MEKEESNFARLRSIQEDVKKTQNEMLVILVSLRKKLLGEDSSNTCDECLKENLTTGGYLNEFEESLNTSKVLGLKINDKLHEINNLF